MCATLPIPEDMAHDARGFDAGAAASTGGAVKTRLPILPLQHGEWHGPLLFDRSPGADAARSEQRSPQIGRMQEETLSRLGELQGLYRTIDQSCADPVLQ